MKRRVEAESFEEEAREKDLSLAEVVQIVCSKNNTKPILLLWTLRLSQQVEERRIRGNRKRSRRSRGGAPELKYKVDNPSALLWTGELSSPNFCRNSVTVSSDNNCLQGSINLGVVLMLWGIEKASSS